MLSGRLTWDAPKYFLQTPPSSGWDGDGEEEEERTESTVTTLTALVVSDIHANIERTEEVVGWMTDTQTDADAVFVLGDIADLKYADMEDPAAVAGSEADISLILATLSSVADTVLYIPGNHDPASTHAHTQALLSPPPPPSGSPLPPVCDPGLAPALSDTSYNLHARVVRLAPDLVVAGFGGAVDATRQGEVVWGGYPISEHDLESALPLLWESALSDASAGRAEGDDSVLLLTHCGPTKSSTSVHDEDFPAPPIQAGSTALSEFLLQDDIQARTVANMHGHTHAGYGLAHMGAVPVFNPGSLNQGRFGVVTLRKSRTSSGGWGPWSLASFSVHLLS